MKFISFKGPDEQLAWGVLEGERILDISSKLTRYPTLLAVIEAGEEALLEINEAIKEQTEDHSWHDRSEVVIQPPHYPKKNIICVGKNYQEHILEMSTQDAGTMPSDPVLFTKPYTAIIGDEETVLAHSDITSELDYEGELAVIIGKEGRNIDRKQANEYIFGYSIINDITARDLQRKHKQFFKGKALDTSAPFGPVIVHHSAVSDPQNLQIQTYVNQELRQNGSTRDMVFPIDELIEVISGGMTLEAGDIIATGTPSGVGKGFSPPKLLQKGDVVRVEIEQIGTLTNRVE